MIKRPLPISIIAWLNIIIGPVGIFATIRALNDPRLLSLMPPTSIPISVHIVISIITTVINFICGIGYLRGKNWARYLFVAVLAFNQIILISTTTFTPAMIPSEVFAVVILYFLFNKKANQYFNGNQNNEIIVNG